MKVTRDHLYDILDMAINDYVEVDTQINHDELFNVLTDFKRRIGKFMDECDDRIENEDSEDYVDNSKDDVDD